MVSKHQFEQQKKLGEDASKVLQEAASLTENEEQKALFEKVKEEYTDHIAFVSAAVIEAITIVENAKKKETPAKESTAKETPKKATKKEAAPAVEIDEDDMF